MNPFEQLGQALTAASHGLTRDDLHRLKGQSDELRRNPMRGCVFQKVASYAAHVYENAEDKGSPGYHLFTKLAGTPVDQWHEGYNRFVLAAMRVFGDDAAADLEKSAALHAGGVLPAIGATAGAASDFYTKLLSMAALGGLGIGSGAWYFNRGVRQDQDKAEGIKAQIAYYKRVANQLNHELAADPTLGADVQRLQDRASMVAGDTAKHLERERDSADRRSRGDVPNPAEAAIYA